MIDSKKIISYIKKHINPYGKPFEGTVFEFGNKVMDYIKAMEKQPKTDCSECSRRKFYQQGYQDGLNADKWIPCEERLPSDNKEYLVTIKVMCLPAPIFSEPNYEIRVSKSKMPFGDNVIAWKPLPQPYKKEGAENEM